MQASALYVGLSGAAYQGLSGGVGIESQVRYSFPDSWSLGGGMQYSRHSFAGGFDLSAPLSLLGVFAEPRLLIRLGSSSRAAYLAARVALLKQSTTVVGVSASRDASALRSVGASGIQFGGGGGLLFVLNKTRGTNLDLGFSGGVVSFGNYSESAGGESVSAGSGMNVVFRVGVWF